MGIIGLKLKHERTDTWASYLWRRVGVLFNSDKVKTENVERRVSIFGLISCGLAP